MNSMFLNHLAPEDSGQVIQPHWTSVTLTGSRVIYPRNTPLWHVDYFELKIIKAQLTQEEPFTPPSPANCLKNLDGGGCWSRKRTISRGSHRVWAGVVSWGLRQVLLVLSTWLVNIGLPDICSSRLPSLWSPKPLLPSLSSGCYMSLHYLTVWETLRPMGLPYFEIKFFSC